MISGYILEKYNKMGDVYTSPRIQEEAGKAGIKLELIGVYDSCRLGDKIINNGSVLTERDFIMNRHKWGKLKDELNGLGRRSYNELDAFKIYVNKYEQLKRLESRLWIKPRYILGNSGISYEELREGLGAVFVAKGLENSMGREIFLIKGEEDYLSLKKYGEEKEWLYEEFISESYGKDLRIYSIRGEAVAAMVRKSDSDFRANVALGSSVAAYDINDEIRSITREIYEQTKLDFIGIDLLFGKDGFYFCEINVMPGLEGIEKASGVNVAGAMIDVIRSDFT